MTYFLLSLTNACNKSCDYCVVKKWRNNPDFPDKITFDDIRKFLDDRLYANDVVELTGGEPTLFSGLIYLLNYLKDKNAKVILRTNGAGLNAWRKDYPNMTVALAKHDSAEEYIAKSKQWLLPHDLVLDGIPEHIRQKEQDKPIFVNDETSPYDRHDFANAYFITADGKVRFMPCCKDDMGTVWDFQPIKYHCCDNCSYMLGAWNLAKRPSD